MIIKRYNKLLILVVIVTYVVIEAAFLYSSLGKFHEGGFITLIIASILFTTMMVLVFCSKN